MPSPTPSSHLQRQAWDQLWRILLAPVDAEVAGHKEPAVAEKRKADRLPNAVGHPVGERFRQVRDVSILTQRDG